MNRTRPICAALTVLLVPLGVGCSQTPQAQRPKLAMPVPSPPIETMQWRDLAMDCNQLKAEYDQLGPLTKDAAQLIPLPKAPIPAQPILNPITFIPLFGPLIAVGQGSAAQERAEFEAAQASPDPSVESAIIAHQRGHEALDRRQYLLFLASQKGCK